MNANKTDCLAEHMSNSMELQKSKDKPSVKLPQMHKNVQSTYS